MARVDAELWRLLESGGLRGNVSERIARAVQDLRATRDELVDARDELRARANEVVGEIARVERLLRAAGAEPKPKRAAKGNDKSVSEELMERVRQTLSGSDDAMTAAEIAAGVSASQSTVNAAVSTLRERGVVRAAGERAGRGHPARLYTLFNEGGEEDGDTREQPAEAAVT